MTEFRSVIVIYNDRAVLEPTLSEALAALFPGFEGDLNDRVDQPAEPTDDTSTPEDTGSGTGSEGTPTDEVDPATALDAAQLLDQADALFTEADEALQANDLGTYQDKIDEARSLVAEAVQRLEGS